MEEQNRETEIRLQDLWLVFKQCWWQALIVLVVVAVAFYAALYITHEDEYTAQVSLYVLTVPGMGSEGSENPTISTSAISIANALINDCEVLIKSEEQVLKPVMVSQNLEGLIEMDELKKMFRPEFLNRVDDIIVFSQLTEDEIGEIALVMLENLKKRLSANDITATVDESAVKLLAKEGFDPVYGARPLRRAIEDHLESVLSEAILSEDVKKGEIIEADLDKDKKIKIKVLKKEK